MNRRMYVVLALLVQQICCWAYPASSSVKYDFTVDDIFYRINADKKSVAVTYNNRGKSYDFYSLPASYSGEVSIPGFVTYNEVTYPVTRIDMCAFLRCEELTAVSIPNSVTVIDNWAFEGCKGLQDIVLPSNLSSVGQGAFSSSGLTSISIPASLKVLQGFGGCINLETVTIAEGVEEIDDRCFSGCSSLNSITLPNSLTSIDENAFSNCTSLNTITIPKNVTKIGSQAFYQCSNLNTVHILCELRTVDITDDRLTFLNVDGSNNGIFQACGDLNVYVTHYYNAAVLLLTNAFNYSGLYQVTSPHFYVNGELVTDFEVPEFMDYVPQASFSHISDMKSIRFHSNLKSIEEYGFYDCGSLETVEYPDALEKIGSHSFQNCSSLTEVKFGKGIKKIHSYAFGGCTQINKVDIGDLANWCVVDFDPDGERFHSSLGAMEVKSSNPLTFAKKIHLNGKQLDRLTIPNGVKSIGLLAFAYCRMFDKLIIPSSVESIGDNAFYECSDMDEIIFKSSTTINSIGTEAFSKCNGLTAITLPDCITKLGTGVFCDCVNLESVNLPSSLTTLPNSIFSGCVKLSSITLPQTLKTIGWWAFSGCKALTRIDIPKSMEIIGTEAFVDCYGLTGVYIEDMAAWCGMKFGNDQYQSSVWAQSDKMTNPLIYAHKLYLNNELVVKLVVPEGVETIEPFTFWGAECIEAVVLPTTVKTIKEKAFWYTKVRSVRIPSSVESIEDNAFGFLGFRKGESISVLLDNTDQWFRNYGIGFYRSGGNGVENPNGHVELYVSVPMFINQLKDVLLDNSADSGVNYCKVDNLIVPQYVTELGKYDLSALSLRFVTLHSGVESLFVSTLDNTPLRAIFVQSRFAPTIYTSSEKTGESTILYSQYTGYKTLAAIYVPKGRTIHYKTKWSGHADIIRETTQDLPGLQSASSIQEMAAACFAVDGNCSFLNLSGATLDETVTNEALQEIAEEGTILFLPEGTEGIEGTNIVSNGTTPKLILGDGADFVTPYDFTATEVVYERSFAASKTEATTLCLPYSVNSLPQGMKAYALQGKDEDGNPVFNEVSTLQANMPYVVTTTIPIENLITENAEIKAIPAETRALDMPDAGDSNFEFVGTLTKLSQSDASDISAYALGDGLSWKAVDDVGVDIIAGRAYLVPKEAGLASYLSILHTTTPYVYTTGDANGDCKVNVADIVEIVNFIQGHTSDDFNKEAANVNSDLDEQGKPKITISDAEGVVKIIMVK